LDWKTIKLNIWASPKKKSLKKITIIFLKQSILKI
jgi:hypothetical protein